MSISSGFPIATFDCQRVYIYIYTYIHIYIYMQIVIIPSRCVSTRGCHGSSRVRGGIGERSIPDPFLEPAMLGIRETLECPGMPCDALGVGSCRFNFLMMQYAGIRIRAGWILNVAATGEVSNGFQRLKTVSHTWMDGPIQYLRRMDLRDGDTLAMQNINKYQWFWWC